MVCLILWGFGLFLYASVQVRLCVSVSQRGDIVPGRNMFQVWGSGGSGLSLIRADTQDSTVTHNCCLFLDLAQSHCGL